MSDPFPSVSIVDVQGAVPDDRDTCLDHLSFVSLIRRLESKPADRVRGLIGSLDFGVSDLATRHREYILESIKRVR